MVTLTKLEGHLILYCKNWYDVKDVTTLDGLKRIWAIRCGYGIECINNGCLESIANELVSIISRIYPTRSIIDFNRRIHHEIGKDYLSHYENLSSMEKMVMIYISIIAESKVRDLIKPNSVDRKWITLIDLPKPKKQLFKRIIRGNGKYNDYEKITK